MNRSRTLALFGTSLLLVAGCMDGSEDTAPPEETVGSFEAASVVPTATIITGTASASNSSSPKTGIFAQCPTGQRVLGGGARVTNNSHIVFTRLEPVHPGSGADTFQIEASEDEVGTVGNWSIQAFAICAPAPAGLTIVSATSATASGSFQNVLVSCPAGTNALGTGGKITGGNGQVDLNVVAEGGAFNPSGATGAGQEDANGFAGNWSATAYAVCASNPIFGDMQKATGTSASDSVNSKLTAAACPAGTLVTGASGFVGSPGVVVDSVVINAARNQVSVQAHEQVAIATSWSVTAYANCAK